MVLDGFSCRIILHNFRATNWTAIGGYKIKIAENDWVEQHLINWPVTAGSGAFILKFLPVVVQATELMELNSRA